MSEFDAVFWRPKTVEFTVSFGGRDMTPIDLQKIIQVQRIPTVLKLLSVLKARAASLAVSDDDYRCCLYCGLGPNEESDADEQCRLCGRGDGR